MGRRKKGESDASTKEKLTDKIGEFLFSRGFLSYTMDEISRFFHVSKKTLYQFFPTKEDMILHISNIFASRLKAFVNRKLEKIESRGPDEYIMLVTELVGRFGQILLSVPATMLSDLESKNPILYARIESIRSSIVKDCFGRVLEAGKKMGKVRADIDADIVSHIYSGMLRQILSRQGLEPSHSPYDIYLTVIKILFQGILVQESKEYFLPESLPRLAHGNLWERIRSSDFEDA
jgi:AcrR family transcriptional regulator